MTSLRTSLKTSMNSLLQNGSRKNNSGKQPNGLRADFSYRPTSSQLAFIQTHNNDAIRAGKHACLSDGGEDSGLDFEMGYRKRSDDMSSESDSSSDDEGYERNKMTYEHYNPDMFENNEPEDYDKTNGDSGDDCTFGQSTKKHLMREILHHGVETRPNIIDDFGGWDASFTVRNSKPSKSNIRRSSKMPRSSSAFPKTSAERKEASYLFKHHDDISEYIRQYREDQSVKDNRLRSDKDGDDSMLVPDPYATKLKTNMCSIAENCDFLTVYSSSAKEKVEKMKEKEPSNLSKEKQPASIILPRQRPSSLVYCPLHDSNEDGPDLRQKRPSSLIYYSSPETRPVLPRLRPLSYSLPKDEPSRPVIVTSLQRPQTSVPLRIGEKTNDRIYTKQQRPSSLVQNRDSSDMAATKQGVKQQPRPYSDQPFVVRTLSIRDRSRMLNLAPVRNQENTQEYRHPTIQANMSLDHYLNLVLPSRQLRSSQSNLTASTLSTTDEKDGVHDKKATLHRKNIQLNIDGPCDPWTPKFEIKRSLSRSSLTPHKHSSSTGMSKKRSTPTPERGASKTWQMRPELSLSRASTYHSHVCPKGDTIDNELTVNTGSNCTNPPNVQRVYGQRFRCSERIHDLIVSDNDDSSKKYKDRHIKFAVDNLKPDKPSPVSFGSFGIRKGMSREDTAVSLSCIYKLKRERQRRFNISLVK